MDFRVLQELVECSVCFERMGQNSKVLPCQHTFCQPCLDSIVRTRGELRCPECRVLVATPVSELPANILLIRLLESLKVAGSGSGVGSALHADVPSPAADLLQDALPSTGALSLASVPCARALFDYNSQESNDLTFKKGDRIVLRKRVDVNWLLGEASGKMGFFPASYVQILIPLPAADASIPRGRALYDFELSGDEKDCLKLRKNDIVLIIRRIDDNWLEGRLGDRVGIFPISYVKLNEAAKNLLKAADPSSSAAASSRLVPPTPTADPTPATAAAPAAAVGLPPGSSAPSSSVTVADEPLYGGNISPTSGALPTATAAAAAASVVQDLAATSRCSARCSHDRNSPKRHSASSFTNTPVICDGASTQRHSMEIPRIDVPAQPRATVSGAAAQVQPCCPLPPCRTTQFAAQSVSAQAGALQRHAGNAGVGSQMVPIHVAMFNYKPQRDDELELEKGKLYKVNDVCRDGWYRGVCLSTNRSGVFPGNYVQSVIGLPKTNGEQRSPSSQLRATASSSPSISDCLANTSSALTNIQDGRSISLLTSATAGDAAEALGSLSLGDATDATAGRALEKCATVRVSSPRRSTPAFAEAVARTSQSSTAALGRSSGNAAVTSAACLQVADCQHGRATSMPMVCNVASEATGCSFISGTLQADRIQRSRRKAGSLDSTLDEPLMPLSDGPRATASACSTPTIAAAPSAAAGAASITTTYAAEQSQRQHTDRLVPPERYCCIVPYPALSDSETELTVGDIVLVHKKHQDGWYKGVHQRTGKRGLFPASFLEKL